MRLCAKVPRCSNQRLSKTQDKTPGCSKMHQNGRFKNCVSLVMSFSSIVYNLGVQTPKRRSHNMGRGTKKKNCICFTKFLSDYLRICFFFLVNYTKNYTSSALQIYLNKKKESYVFRPSIDKTLKCTPHLIQC